MIDPNKTYRTRDGRPVAELERLPHEDADYYWTGLVDYERVNWTENGCYLANHSNFSPYDLVEVKAPTMTIDPNKTYRTCDGRAVTNLRRSGNVIWPWAGKTPDGHTHTWTDHGYNKRTAGSRLDLVEVKAPTMTIDPTKTYRTRDGSTAHHIEHLPHYGVYVWAATVTDASNGRECTISYTADGFRFDKNNPNKYDLIEPFKSPLAPRPEFKTYCEMEMYRSLLHAVEQAHGNPTQFSPNTTLCQLINSLATNGIRFTYNPNLVQ